MSNRIILYCLSVYLILQIRQMGATDRALNLNRILFGTDASLDEAKHQVSIRSRREESFHFGFGHTCSGSLISENVVLTAAHCFLNPSGSASFFPDKNYIVVMGNLDRFEHNNNTLIFNILKTVKSSFDVETNDEDIALIFLNGSVPAEHPTIKPITLNEGSLKNRSVICQTTGWGLTEINQYSQMLRIVNLPLIDSNECRQKSIYGPLIREGMLCAGYLEGDLNPCRGDSGGALVCRGVMAGILSWGYACGWTLRPSVSTDVAFYKNWILQTIIEHNGSLPEFTSVPAGVMGFSDSTFLIICLLLLNLFNKEMI